MANPTVPVTTPVASPVTPFTSTPTGRAIKTLGAGVIGYVISNFAPVVSTLSPQYQGIVMVIIAMVCSGVGRWSKQQGIDLGAI